MAIGDRVVVQDGAVIGSDGFGFARRPDGTHQKIPQVGRVVIEDDVEIGANSTIDRPAVGETRIGPGTKIDNLVQIAHGVRIGRNVLLAAQVGIAGSTVLDDDVMLAGQSGVDRPRAPRARRDRRREVRRHEGRRRRVITSPAFPPATSTTGARRPCSCGACRSCARPVADLEARLAALEADG